MSDGAIMCSFAAVCVGIFALLIGGAMWFSSASCHSQAAALSLSSSWGPLQDCVVMDERGRRWLLDQYRTVRVNDQ